MTKAELYQKACMLPLLPGVYIIRDKTDTIIYIGIACFGLSVVFQFATLPVEFNASHRALQTIESTGILTEEEQKGARKTLTAAAMTYVAATATALAQLLRLIVLFGRRSNNNRR